MLTSSQVNITEESLECHHLLFIHDVTTATYNVHKDCFQSKTTNLSFRRAKLNGIIVAQESLLSDNCIWLDDGTSVIRVILHKSLLKRPKADKLSVSNNVTLFGKVEFYNDNELVIQCIGFRVEETEAAEMYHWLKVIQDRPKVTKTTEQNMFYSLSSIPSPTRLLRENFLESPIRDIHPKNANYLWSPDHAFATSTPIRAIQDSPLRQSPFRQSPFRQKIESPAPDFDDEFVDFGSIDFGALEQNALLQKEKNNKRKFTE